MATNQVGQAVQGLIDKWLKRSERNNINLLARKCGISSSSLYRLKDGLVEKPQLDHVLAVLSVTASDEETYGFMKEHYPEAAHSFSRYQNKLHPEEKVNVCQNESTIDKLMANPETFPLVHELLSQRGVVESKALSVHGSFAYHAAVAPLKAEGLIKEEDGVLRGVLPQYSSTSLAAAKNQVASNALSWKPESIGVSAGFIRTMSESVSLSGARQIAAALQTAVDTIRTIRDKNPGPHVFTASVVVGLVDPASATEEYQ